MGHKRLVWVLLSNESNYFLECLHILLVFLFLNGCFVLLVLLRGLVLGLLLCFCGHAIHVMLLQSVHYLVKGRVLSLVLLPQPFVGEQRRLTEELVFENKLGTIAFS